MVFEVLEHPADIGFRAYGQAPADLFAHAAVALISIADDPDAVEPRAVYPLEANGEGYESLLVNWLSEVLFWYDGKRIGFREFQVRLIEPTRIQAIGLGEPRDADRHQSRLIVKAVTWHQLKVWQEADDGWLAEVYLDI